MMNTIEKEREINNAIAGKKDKLYQKPSMRALFEQQFESLFPHLQDRKLLVEIGCGNGDFLERCAQTTQLEKICGTDISSACIAISQERLARYKNTIFAEGDAAEIDKICANFISPDAIVMRGVIHHLENPRHVFEACHRLLDAQGKLIIFEGNKSSTYRSMVLKCADAMGIEHEASQFTHTPPEQIVKTLEDIGFKNIKVSYVCGFVAPLSYTGIGGTSFWRYLMKFNAIGNIISSRFFGWWYLLSAEK